MKTVLDYNCLRGALECAAKDGVKEYIAGVLVRTNKTEVTYLSTDGCTALKMVTQLKDNEEFKWEFDVSSLVMLLRLLKFLTKCHTRVMC